MGNSLPFANTTIEQRRREGERRKSEMELFGGRDCLRAREFVEIKLRVSYLTLRVDTRETVVEQEGEGNCNLRVNP